jgi:hypothetical protein
MPPASLKRPRLLGGGLVVGVGLLMGLLGLGGPLGSQAQLP